MLKHRFDVGYMHVIFFSCPYSLSESDQRFASEKAASTLNAPSRITILVFKAHAGAVEQTRPLIVFTRDLSWDQPFRRNLQSGARARVR